MKKLTALIVAALLVSALFIASVVPAMAAESENLAEGKPVYGISPIEGDDTRKGDLTDGKFPAEGKGWYVGSGEAGSDDYLIIIKGQNASDEGVAVGIIDLQSHSTVEKLRVYIGTGMVNYAVFAPAITVELSDNGTDYAKFAEYTYDDEKDFWDFVIIEGEATKARYVKLTFAIPTEKSNAAGTSCTAILLGEVEVWGEKGEADTSDPVIELPAEGGDEQPSEGGDDQPSEGGDDQPSESGDDQPAESGDDQPSESKDEQPTESKDDAAQSEDDSAADEKSEDASAPAPASDNEGGNGVIVVVIIVVCVIVAAVVLVLLTRKKK